MGDFWLVDMSRLSGRLSMHACIPRGPTVTRVPPEKAARTRQTAISTQIMQQQKVVCAVTNRFFVRRLTVFFFSVLTVLPAVSSWPFRSRNERG